MAQQIRISMFLDVYKDSDGNLTVSEIYAAAGKSPGRKIVCLDGMKGEDGAIEDLILAEMGTELQSEYEEMEIRERAEAEADNRFYGDKANCSNIL